MSKRKRKNKKKKDRVLITSIMILLLCIIGIIGYLFIQNKEIPIVKKHKKKLTIVDEDSNKRPIAVMIDNNVGNNSHAGLQDSYINYEIIVEGGLTRIMAIFKDKDVDLIGPVRSSRHYFLDYALESDAIYTHYGWSEFAKTDISSLGVNNINGLYDENAFWRDKQLKSPHNVFTNTDTLYKYAKDNKDYSIETDDWKLLNYSTKNISIADKEENDNTANNVVIKYSNYQTTSYSYDSENKYYLRYMNDEAHIDKTSNEQLHYKNIIIEKVKNSTLDSYGRQDLDTTGSGEGYYVTNGYVKEITWTKNSRSGKTTYTYEDGKEVKINDGNTFIQIIPVTVTPEIN